MTYTGCIIILATILICTRLICAITGYRKIKKAFPNSRAQVQAADAIFMKPFLVFVIAFLFWVVSMFSIALIGSNIPVETEFRSAVNSDNQIVVFKEQRSSEYVVSVEGTEYICNTLVLSEDITSAQVKFVECKTADNFFAKFFFKEFTGHTRFYELHIPVSSLSPS